MLLYFSCLVCCCYTHGLILTSSGKKELCSISLSVYLYEPRHGKTNKVTVRASEDSDQPGHPPSLIRVFAVRSVGS